MLFDGKAQHRARWVALHWRDGAEGEWWSCNFLPPVCSRILVGCFLLRPPLSKTTPSQDYNKQLQTLLNLLNPLTTALVGLLIGMIAVLGIGPLVQLTDAVSVS